MTGPLAGIRVLAFTHVAAGPYATMQLAYLGAEVIKVESTTRIDYWRYRDRNRDPEMSRTFADHNKGVRSVTLDLKHPTGLVLARELAARSDVVVDNYTPGVMDRLGLGYSDLVKLNPRAIVVHLNGLGSEGPRSAFVTFGPSLMSYAGMAYLWNHPDQKAPVGSQSSYPDYLGGVQAAFAVITALHRRERGAGAQLLDLAQALVTAAAIGPTMTRVLAGEEVRAVGNEVSDRAPHGCYPCAAGDDSWCVISVGRDEEWAALRRVMGDPAWAFDERFATWAGRVAARSELDGLIAGWTVGLAPRAVMERCQAAGVPAGIVATGEDLASDPHLRERGFLLEVDHPRIGRMLLPGIPVRFAHAPLEVQRAGPLLGQDNHEIFERVLGLRREEVDILISQGAIH